MGKKIRTSMFFQTLGRLARSNLAVAGFSMLFAIVIVCVLAPVIAPYSPDEMSLSMSDQLPSWQHLCGTDNYGRDLFTRLLYGGRYSLSIGICAAFVSTAAGMVIGLIAGFFGGIRETLIMRFTDILQAIPGILIAVLISTVLGSGFVNTVLALSVGGIPFGIRITRGQILSELSKEYLEAAESINAGRWRIMFSHLLPNILSPLIVFTTMSVGGTIMAAAGLSFIGLGIQPPTPEWGAMLSAGRNYIQNYPYLVLFPGLCIAFTVLAINILGDGLRDVLDPKMKK